MTDKSNTTVNTTTIHVIKSTNLITQKHDKTHDKYNVFNVITYALVSG